MRYANTLHLSRIMEFLIENRDDSYVTLTILRENLFGFNSDTLKDALNFLEGQKLIKLVERYKRIYYFFSYASNLAPFAQKVKKIQKQLEKENLP